MNLNAVNVSIHINLLGQGFDIVSQFRGVLLLCRKWSSVSFQPRELEGINVFPSALDGFNEVCGFLVEFWWDWWHRVSRDVAEGVEVGGEDDAWSRGTILGFRVVAYLWMGRSSTRHRCLNIFHPSTW